MPTREKDVSIVRRTMIGGGIYDQSIQAQSTFLKVWSHTPNFRELKASGARLPDLDYQRRHCLGSGGAGVFADGYITYSPGYYVFPHVVGVDVDLMDSAKVELINKAKGEQWNVPVFVAEGRKTAQMVFDRAKHLATMVFELRRGRIDRFASMFHDSVSKPSARRRNRWKSDYGKDALKAQSSIWLEAQYGWVPFMLDVRNAVNATMDAVETPSMRVGKVVAMRSRSRIYYEPEGLIFSLPTYGIATYGRAQVFDRQSARAVWHFAPTGTDLPGRFGLLNPAEVVWELIPLSFVADWFLPIGDYLSTLDAPFRFAHVGGTIGQRRELVRDWKKTRDAGATKSSPSSGSAFTSATYVARTPLYGIPMPSLANLAFSPKLGVARTVSGIALLTQQLSRLGKR